MSESEATDSVVGAAGADSLPGVTDTLSGGDTVVGADTGSALDSDGGGADSLGPTEFIPEGSALVQSGDDMIRPFGNVPAAVPVRVDGQGNLVLGDLTVVGVDTASGPDVTAGMVREADGTLRHATADEIEAAVAATYSDSAVAPLAATSDDIWRKWIQSRLDVIEHAAGIRPAQPE